MNLQQIIDAVRTEFGNIVGLATHTYPDGQQGIAVTSSGGLVAVFVSVCPHSLWRAVRTQVRQVRRVNSDAE